VLTFYLGRPVIPVRTPSTPAAPGRRLERGYLAVANRLLPQWSATCPAPAIGAGMVNGLRFSVLWLEPPGCPRRSHDMARTEALYHRLLEGVSTAHRSGQ